MKQRTALPLCCLCVSLICTGCYSTSQLSRDEIERGADYDICGVVTSVGDTIMLKEVSGRSGIIRDSTIVGVCEDGKVARIPLSQVRSVQVTYFEGGETVFAVLGITAAFLTLLTWASMRGNW